MAEWADSWPPHSLLFESGWSGTHIIKPHQEVRWRLRWGGGGARGLFNRSREWGPRAPPVLVLASETTPLIAQN
jgi:hypothetical protein